MMSGSSHTKKIGDSVTSDPNPLRLKNRSRDVPKPVRVLLTMHLQGFNGADQLLSAMMTSVKLIRLLNLSKTESASKINWKGRLEERKIASP